MCRYYSQACDVVLGEFGTSPAAFEASDDRAPYASILISWSEATARDRAAWANTDDATRDAAYGVAIAYVQLQYNLVAVSRSDRMTGCDYWFAPPRRAVFGTRP